MTKEELNRLLVGIGKFSSNDVDLFRTEVRTRNFKKGDCLLEVGDVCRSMYYVVSGSICEFGLLEDREFIQGFLSRRGMVPVSCKLQFDQSLPYNDKGAF